MIQSCDGCGQIPLGCVELKKVDKYLIINAEGIMLLQPGRLHSTEVVFEIRTQQPRVRISPQPILLYCLVCGQKRFRTHLVLMRRILQLQLAAKAWSTYKNVASTGTFHFNLKQKTWRIISKYCRVELR